MGNISEELMSLQSQHLIAQLHKGSDVSLPLSLFKAIQYKQQLGIDMALKSLSVLKSLGMDVKSNAFWSNHFSQLCAYNVLYSGLVFAYNIQKGEMEIHTSSIETLKRLVKSDYIDLSNVSSLAKEQDRWETALGKGKLVQAFAESNTTILPTLRLDKSPDGIRYVVKSPRPTFDLDNFIIVPVECMSKALTDFRNLVSNQIVRVQMGDKVRYVTTDSWVLSKVYGDERAKVLISNVRMDKDYIYLPSVGESRYAPGLTRITIANVDSVSRVTLEDISLDNVEVNYDMARVYMLSILDESIGRSIAERLGIATDGVSSSDDLLDKVRGFLNIMYPTEIVDLLKYLGKFETFMTNKGPVGSQYTLISTPKTIGELSARLSTGMYKIVIVRRDGLYSTMIVTCNNKVLTKLLGRNYLGNYASEGVRLNKLSKNILKSNSAIPLKTIISWCNILKLDTVRFEFEMTYPLGGDIEVEKALEIVRKYQGDVDTRRTNYSNSKTVLAYNCFPTISHGTCRDFYKNIDPESITEMYCLELQEEDEV